MNGNGRERFVTPHTVPAFVAVTGMGLGVIFEQELEDVLSEIDEECPRRCDDIDVNDPRLISESIEINPEADALGRALPAMQKNIAEKDKLRSEVDRLRNEEQAFKGQTRITVDYVQPISPH